MQQAPNLCERREQINLCCETVGAQNDIITQSAVSPPN